jgi:hypothetical protein
LATRSSIPEAGTAVRGTRSTSRSPRVDLHEDEDEVGMMIERIMNRAMKLSPEAGRSARGERGVGTIPRRQRDRADEGEGAGRLPRHPVPDFTEGGTRFLGDAEIRIHPGCRFGDRREDCPGVRMVDTYGTRGILLRAGAVNSGGAAAVSDSAASNRRFPPVP